MKGVKNVITYIAVKYKVIIGVAEQKSVSIKSEVVAKQKLLSFFTKIIS